MSSHGEWPHNLAHGWTDISPDRDRSQLIRPVWHEGEPYGWIEAHRDRAGNWCSGVVQRRGTGPPGSSRPTWRVVSEDPLTLDPSVQCTVCAPRDPAEGRVVDLVRHPRAQS